jgi:cobalt/nickel transport system permease protein
MGFFPAFIAYPFIYKPLVGENPTQGRLFFAAVLSAVIGLQMGAFGVVMETFLSGVSELPFGAFVLLMQPIHLAIGFVEGLITATVILFIWKEAPEILRKSTNASAAIAISYKRVLAGLVIATVLIAGGLSWFASSNPDGLEWSIANITGEDELKSTEGIHGILAEIQEKIAFLPDYNFKQTEQPATAETNEKAPASWPSVDTGTSVAGIVGSILTLVLAYSIGKGLQRFAKQ